MNHAENKQHPWQPGELCTCTYGNVGKGIVYRVTKVDNTVTKWGLSCTLDLIPVHGVLADVGAHRPRRSMGAGYCTPLSLIELATEYAKLGNFIRDEAMKKGEDGAA